jgi:hypothetical protein
MESMFNFVKILTICVLNWLLQKTNILNHIAYLVEDIDKYFNEFLSDEFIKLGSPQKAVAYNMNNIQFFYAGKFGYCLELIESSKHTHVFSRHEFNK